jgi:hypothetical protein
LPEGTSFPWEGVDKWRGCNEAPITTLITSEKPELVSINPLRFRGFNFDEIPSKAIIHEVMIYLGGVEIRADTTFLFEETVTVTRSDGSTCDIPSNRRRQLFEGGEQSLTYIFSCDGCEWTRAHLDVSSVLLLRVSVGLVRNIKI